MAEIFVGLYFLSTSEVEDSFCEDFMSATSEDHRCSKYVDYLFENSALEIPSRNSLQKLVSWGQHILILYVVILLYVEWKESLPGKFANLNYMYLKTRTFALWFSAL